MAKFQANYTEESYGLILFDAENIQEARKLYNQLFDNEIFEDDLPGYFRREKSGQVNYDNLIELTPTITILKDNSE